MPKLPVVTPKKIITLLKKHGFQLDHTTGSHYIFYHPISQRRTTVSYHAKDLPKGTLYAILEQAGISLDNLFK